MNESVSARDVMHLTGALKLPDGMAQGMLKDLRKSIVANRPPLASALKLPENSVAQQVLNDLGKSIAERNRPLMASALKMPEGGAAKQVLNQITERIAGRENGPMQRMLKDMSAGIASALTLPEHGPEQEALKRIRDRMWGGLDDAGVFASSDGLRPKQFDWPSGIEVQRDDGLAELQAVRSLLERTERGQADAALREWLVLLITAASFVVAVVTFVAMVRLA